MEIITRKQALEQNLKYYFTGKPCKNKHVSKYVVSNYLCVVCQKLNSKKSKVTYNQRLQTDVKFKEAESIKDKARSKSYRERFPEKIKLQNRSENSRAAMKRWGENNKDRKRLVSKKWREANKEHHKELIRQWGLKHPERKRASCASRRARKLKASPKWRNEDLIRDIYDNCPKGKEVDHIFPLQGKLVCGLHVGNNLQYLTRKENREKGNKFVPYYQKGENNYEIHIREHLI